MQFAKAIVEEGEKVSLCNSASNEAAAEIAKIMGREAETIVPKKAVVLCSKNEEGTKQKYSYYGVSDCFAAQRILGGPNACKYGCIGFGSCVSVCPEDAISIKNSLAVVNEKKCIGCGACKNHCPQNIIELVPKDISVYVKCKNADKGSETRKVCDSGCIGCGICAKNCESGAIDVSGVAKIDYEKCTSCGNCIEKCPKKVVKKC
jgi:ferredoxin